MMYGKGFLSQGFTDRCEILHGGSATSRTGLFPFGGIAPGMAEFWASTGAIWRDMLLAEALVSFIIILSIIRMSQDICGALHKKPDQHHISVLQRD